MPEPKADLVGASHPKPTPTWASTWAVTYQSLNNDAETRWHRPGISW